LDRANEYKNDAAVDVMSKWAWDEKEDCELHLGAESDRAQADADCSGVAASWLTAILTMNEKELTLWAMEQKMGANEQQKAFEKVREGRASLPASNSETSAPRQHPGNRSAADESLSHAVEKLQRLPLPFLPRKPSPEQRPDFSAGFASLPPRLTPAHRLPPTELQSTRSRKRPIDTAFAPLPTLPRLASPRPLHFSSDSTILVIQGLPHDLGINKKDILELLKNHGAEKLDVRDVKMMGVKAPTDDKGKRMKDSEGKKLGGTLKVEIELHSAEVCDKVGSSLEGRLWCGVKVEAQWIKSR
jgi:hypothetical protein